MRYRQGMTARIAFAAWLRGEMDKQGYKTPLGHFCIGEFAKQHGLNATSLGRYISPKSPVLPTTEMCRALAEATGENFVVVLRLAGYQSQDDLDVYVQEAIDSGRFDTFCRARFEQVQEPIAA